MSLTNDLMARGVVAIPPRSRQPSKAECLEEIVSEVGKPLPSLGKLSHADAYLIMSALVARRQF